MVSPTAIVFVYPLTPRLFFFKKRRGNHPSSICWCLLLYLIQTLAYGWNQLRVQDFKSVDAYNHAVHKISQKLKFCEKEPSDLYKIEKTLSTMLPLERLITQQYREKTLFASGREKSWAHCLELTAAPSGYCSSAWSACHSKDWEGWL